MDEPEKKETIQVDPLKQRQELVNHFLTATRYVRRQGLSLDECHALLDDVDKASVGHDWTPEGTVLISTPKLYGRGVNDMRDRMAN